MPIKIFPIFFATTNRALILPDTTGAWHYGFQKVSGDFKIESGHLCQQAKTLSCLDLAAGQRSEAHIKIHSKWLNEHKQKLLPWPPQFPDLSPVKTLWAELKKRVCTKRPRTCKIWRDCALRNGQKSFFQVL